jgi:hypothetical protein
MSYIYFLNPHSNLVYEVIVQDGAVERFTALGWTQVDKPEDGNFVPSGANDGGSTTYVRLRYVSLNVTHDYPNRAEVIAGALEAGWTYP